MKIALVQMICKSGDVEFNLATMEQLAGEAKRQGADVVVFPEMSDTGYHMPTVLATASTAEGRPRAQLRECARRLEVWLIAGLSLRESDKVYNTCIAFDPSGDILAEYRKVHLFSGEPVREDGFLCPGDQLACFDLAGMRTGLLICYDLRFPEIARSLMLENAKIILFVSAWPSPRIAHWSALLTARAIENQCYVIGVNRAGVDEGLEMGGTSMAVDPFGVELSRGTAVTQQVLLVEIDHKRLMSVRESSPALRDRRPKMYRV